MLKQKYSRQKEETDEMEKRRNKLEAQMNEVNNDRIFAGACIDSDLPGTYLYID